jgi:hypothetical protein
MRSTIYLTVAIFWDGPSNHKLLVKTAFFDETTEINLEDEMTYVE